MPTQHTAAPGSKCCEPPDLESDLVRGLQHKSPGALEKLYDLYGGVIYSLILRMVCDAGTAEDLVQETFLRVWIRARSFDARRPLRPWLLTIARNRALDHLRCSDNRTDRRIPTWPEMEDPKVLAVLERNIAISGSQKSLSEALQTLSLNQRTVIDLAYFEGYTQSEIAEKLEAPIGTVKTWVRGALLILRGELREVPTRRVPASVDRLAGPHNRRGSPRKSGSAD